MSVITPQLQAPAADRTFIRSQATLGRSLSRLAASSKISPPSLAGSAGLAVSGKTDAHGKRVQAAMTGVQDAVSAVQAVDGLIGGMSAILEHLQRAGASLQVESGNLAAVIAPIRDEAGAGKSTVSAASGILVQPGLATVAQANVSQEGALRLLES